MLAMGASTGLQRAPFKKVQIYHSCLLKLSLKPQVWYFHVIVLKRTVQIALKSMPHVQHDYFSWFNQSGKFLIYGVVVAADVVNAKASISEKRNTNRWLKSIFPRFAPAARGCFAL